MFRKLKKSFADLANGRPGCRFVQHHEQHLRAEGRREAAWKTALFVVAGLTLLIAGLLLSIPPGIPGFLLWVPALGLLVARSRPLALGLDRAELFVRRMADRFRRS